MSKHTPGPWCMIIDDTGGQFSGWPSVEAPSERDHAVVHLAGFKQEHWGDLSLRETLANAQLIAAAPDLLETLIDFAAQAEQYLLDPRRTLDMAQWQATIREAKDAIAKATGS